MVVRTEEYRRVAQTSIQDSALISTICFSIHVKYLVKTWTYPTVNSAYETEVTWRLQTLLLTVICFAHCMQTELDVAPLYLQTVTKPFATQNTVNPLPLGTSQAF